MYRAIGRRAFAAGSPLALAGACVARAGDATISDVKHCLKAVTVLGVAKSKSDGRAVIEQMKRMPVEDPLFVTGMIRADGRELNEVYVMQAKKPMESKYPWDYCGIIGSVPADLAFRPMANGGCAMVNG